MTSFPLRGAHPGREAWVLGGAASLPEEMKRCPEGALLISANEHGCKFTRCDYIASLDDIEAKVAPYGVPRISPHMWAEHPFLETDYHVANSACFGAYLAHLMGCTRIVIAGVDLYRSGYFHDPTPIRKVGTERDRLNDWAALRDLLPAGLVFAAGGPVLQVFPEYLDGH